MNSPEQPGGSQFLRESMMSLWKETFHDSDRYIDLVFDTYFQPENVFSRLEGEKLISALLGIPYEFRSAGSGSNDKVKGFYLCGLATRPEQRGKGIMSGLMKEAEEAASKRGFDMTFLIPADDDLRQYYKRSGYHDFSYRKREPLEIDYREYDRVHVYAVSQIQDSGNPGFVGELAKWCIRHEKENNHPMLLHSKIDMAAALRENENSFFVTEDTFDLKYPILAKVRGVVFPEELTHGNSGITIIKMFFDDTSSDTVKIEKGRNSDGEKRSGAIPDFMKSAIRRMYPDRNVTLQLPCGYKEFCEEPSKCRPYAMAKILNCTKFDRNHEIPVFDISLMLD